MMHPSFAQQTRRRGSVFVLTLAVLLVLTSLALMMARGVRVEASGAANTVAMMQADAIAHGATEYVRSIVDGTNGTLPTDDQVLGEAVPVGDGYFWLLKPDLTSDSGTTWAYGLIDEASKLNLNTPLGAPATTAGTVGRPDTNDFADMITLLPGMTSDMAASVVNWRLPDGQGLSNGATSQFYQMLPRPYASKSGPFETVEELLLIKDVTPDMLYGEDANRNGVLDPNEDDADTSDPSDNRDGQLDRGIAPFVTVYSMEPNQNTPASSSNPGTPSPAAPPLIGRINLNTAPRQVLFCLPGVTQSDVDAIIAHRQSSTTGNGFASVNELVNVIDSAKATAILRRGLVTTQSYVCSADIVAVDGSGRAFKRYLAVFDARSSPVRIIYWRDLTALGWPLDPAILTTLRSGQRLMAMTATPAPPSNSGSSAPSTGGAR